MSGLLDFMRTPEGQGLLSAVAGGMATANRGTPFNNLGRAGLAGLAGYSGAVDRQQQQADGQFQQQYRTLQMDELKRKQAEAAAQQQWRQGLPDVLKQSQTTYGAGDEGPTMTPGNPDALKGYLMRPDSPFLDDMLKQQMFPTPDDYKVVGSDLVKIGKGGVTVAHQSQRPDNITSDQKQYNLAVEQGFRGTFMDFLRERVNTTEGAKAGFDLIDVTTPDGKAYKVPRVRAVGMAGGSTPSPRPNGYAGGSAAAAANDQVAIISKELENARAAGRAQDVLALENELGRLTKNAPGLQVQSEADRALSVERAKDAATGKTQERESAKEAQRASIDMQISVIDKALNHPGRATATGLSSAIDPRNYVPGTDARDFQVVLDQLGGAAFLQAFESLKGGGQITEVEGKKATAAIARLNRTQSDKEFEASLRELKTIMENGRRRLGGGVSASFDQPAQRQVKRTGMYGGRRVIEYTDGSVEYAN